jgi:hypothetical protein
VTDGKKVIANKMIETRLDLYASFFDHRWAQELDQRTPPKLAEAVESLCLAWKEAAATHRLPWLMIHQMEAFAGGMIRGHKPRMARLVEALKSWVWRELDGSLQRAEKKKLIGAIKKADQSLRLSDHKQDVKIPAVAYWNDLIDKSEFQFSIIGSQNLSYCGLVFGYEWFLVSCFRVLGGPDKYKSNEDRFWTDFTARLGGDPKAEYWEDRPVKIARIARNCIAHSGGKAKPELLAEKPDLFVSDDGLITVRPSNNRALFEVLKEKVTRLVGEVAPKLV